MSTENILAAIPKDQLILKLLQELAIRVANLEKDEAVQGHDPGASESLLENSRENAVTTVNESNTAESTPESPGAEHGEQPRCQGCGELLVESCHCIEVRYGSLLEDETPSEDMKTIEERVDELKTSEQGRRHLARLKRLGIAAVPADGRLGFTNFWSPTTSPNLEKTIEYLERLFSNGGNLSITDFDSHGNYMKYGLEKFSKAGIRESEESAPFLVPSNRINPATRYTAPWKRLVILAGLNHKAALGPPPFFVASDSRMLPVEPHLYPYDSFNRIQTVPYDTLRTATYIRIFHLYGYEVTTRISRGHSTWKRGVLPGKTKWLMQLVHTITAIYHDTDLLWTLVVLLPPKPSKSFVIEQHLQTRICKDRPLVIVIADAIYYILESTWEGWDSLVRYIDQLLGTGNEIFDIEAHDELIFDDDLYTRSRRYFWAINCLNKSLNLLQRNMQTWTEQREDVLSPMAEKLSSVEMRKEFDKTIGKCDETLAKLMKVKESFNEQRTRAVALRDGLFSASAVMESRASTRLGENVKFLTYVSIFYLPLAFCTSIWSTTDTFGYRNLAITMLVISLLTYLIVFNLNLIVSFSKTSYSSLKSGILSSMKNDSREKWYKKGELFHKYRPRETADESKPSEWWILVYLLQRVWDVVLFRGGGGGVREKGAKGKRTWPSLWDSGRQGERDRAEPDSEAGDAQA